MTKKLALVALAGATIVAGCEGFGQAMTAHTDAVARVAGHELTVDDAAMLLSQNPRLSAQPEIVEALANLWIDYIVLAKAVSQDPPLAGLDMATLLRPYQDQELIRKLGERVLDREVELSEAELRALFEDEQPGLEVRARHILLRIAPDASSSERDSVRAKAEELRERATAGEDFAVLAGEHSQDPGSREQGGDLGFFGPNQMVAPFEEAAFALGVGEISPVVETPFGYHVIRVEERRLPEFDEVKDMYRDYAVSERQRGTEERYIRELTEPLGIKVQEGAYDVARELAQKPNLQLSGRAASRPLVSYRGGGLTAGEYQKEMRRLPPSFRARYATAGDEQLEQVLTQLTHRELLIAEAEQQGLALTAEEQTNLEAEVRRQLEGTAEVGSLTAVQPQAGETLAQAIDRKVLTLLDGIVKEERNVLSIDPLLAAALRESHDIQIFERAFPTVVARVQSAAPALPAPSADLPQDPPN